ncbi:MAG: sulfide/dihydroorotate dehydrogenase-like FAD/NAD-binding protein [Candidatus Omnitrophica bacterium]|nr:sulfide/dihydroorotate dehydrogenase-like FAD/NAD-binding protein [Candidatus Omnitrophota bacterium]
MASAEPAHPIHEGRSFKILKKERLTPATHRFLIEAPWVAQAAKPGQFVIVRVREGGERIPVTIADFDAPQGTVTVVVQEVGRTSKLFGALQEGQEVLDLVGPLGEPFRLMRGKRVIGVGGGFGAAALYPLLRGLRQAGVPTEAIIGARNKELLILRDELSSVCELVMPCTDDGSVGFKGFVTDCLKQRLQVVQPLGEIEVVAVGPMPMMRAVAAVTAEFHVPTQVSLDPIMVDGTGMCGGCRVTVGGASKFACVDGPMFDAHQVDFDECVRRSKMYRSEEQLSNAA